MYNALVKWINVQAVGWNYLYKVQEKYTGQISLCTPKVQRWQDFRTEIIDFVLSSGAWSCLSQGPARVKLWSVHCDLLESVCVCGVIKKKYCFIKSRCAAAMTPVNADCCWSVSLGREMGFFFICPLIAKAISVKHVNLWPSASKRLKDTLERTVYLCCCFEQFTSATHGLV